jgi:hypothetical protein
MYAKSITPASVAAPATRRPGIALAAVGLVVAIVAVVPELLLSAHLSSGGGVDPLVLTLVNRLITIATVTGAALCAAGVVLEITRRLPPR